MLISTNSKRLQILSSLLMFAAGSVAIAQNPNPASSLPNPAPLPAVVLPAEGTPGTLTIVENASIRLQTRETISSKHAKGGTPVLFLVSEDVMVQGKLAIPRGASVRGVVVESKKSGVLSGQPELSLDLIALELGGVSYPISTYTFRVKGVSKTPQTQKDVKIGMEAGALAGVVSGVTRSQKGNTNPSDTAVRTLAGTAAGASVGAVVSAAKPGPELWIPAESQVEFLLASALTVTPVSKAEVARLAQGLRRGGTALYVRGDQR